MINELCILQRDITLQQDSPLSMANNYDSYSKQDLIQLLNKRDHERKLGLVWERDDIEHERTLNSDFVTLELDQELSP